MIYGTRASRIATFQSPSASCDYCHQHSTQSISVFGRYLHIFWIPVFPLGRKTVAECSHCKRTIEESHFSPELRAHYQAKKASIKRPLWHWSGLLVIGAFIALILIIDATTEKDPRQALLRADLDSMSFSPDKTSDSTSYKIKTFFTIAAAEGVGSEDFKYRTIIKDDKVLTLIKIPDLKDADKKEREIVIDLVEKILDHQADTKTKQKYIGIHGKYNMMLVKTPTESENSKIASETPLYEFYGPASGAKK